MIEKDGISHLAPFVGYGGSLNGDGNEKVTMTFELDEFALLLNGARDSTAISANVTKKLCKFACFETKLTQTFVAGCSLSSTQASRQI